MTATMNDQHTLPIDGHVISLEETEHWHLEGTPGADKIERIETVFFFDRNVRHFACEITPSYLLHPVETRAIFKSDVEVTDEEQDAVDSAIMANSDTDTEYHHVRDVEGYIENLREKPFRYHHYGETKVSYDECSYDEQVEGILEHLRGNSVI